MNQGDIVRFNHRLGIDSPQDGERENNGKPVVIIERPRPGHNTYKVMGVDGSVFYAHRNELTPLQE